MSYDSVDPSARLTLKDLKSAPHHFLVVKRVAGSRLRWVFNPLTGRPFEVGDVVEWHDFYSVNEGLFDLVRLEGVVDCGGFYLDAFRMPTGSDLFKYYCAVAPALKSWRQQFMETLKPAMEALMENYRMPTIDVGSKTVGPDQEVWVRERIETAIRMGISAYRQTRVRADAPVLSSAINGLANGAAVEVIRALGLTPGYVNLRRSGDNAPVNSSEPQAEPSKKSEDRPVPSWQEVARASNPKVTCARCGRVRRRDDVTWSRGLLVCKGHLNYGP